MSKVNENPYNTEFRLVVRDSRSGELREHVQLLGCSDVASIASHLTELIEHGLGPEDGGGRMIAAAYLMGIGHVVVFDTDRMRSLNVVDRMDAARMAGNAVLAVCGRCE